jgi:hypothetical protein
MERGIFGHIAAIIIGGLLGTASANSAWAQGTCESVIAAKTPTITAAYRYEVVDRALRATAVAFETARTPPDAATRAKALIDAANRAKATPEARAVALGDIVTVEGSNLDSLFDATCANRRVVLFLNNWPITDVTPMPPANPADGKLNFKLVTKLRGTDTTPDTWLPILGKPGFGAVPVRVSIGFVNGYAMAATPGAATAVLDFTVLPASWFACWAAIFLAMLGLFVWMVRSSNVLRDAAPNTPGGGTYSLSRTQGAFWFFIILAAYLFIGLVTGDFSNSINSTALILLGIGAGTVLGSAAIDVQKDTDRAKAETISATADITAKIAAAEARTVQLTVEIAAEADAAAKLTKTAERTEQIALTANLQSRLDKLNGKSEGFLIDILSDANGISFHRFQIFVWTVVLGLIFVVAVYQNLAMPTFNTTLMGLLGLSAGTYLGLKIPEPTTPTR